MPLSRPRSFPSARFRNTGMLKIPLWKFFFFYHTGSCVFVIRQEMFDHKKNKKKKSHNLKRLKEIDMKNIFILQICFKYHIFSPLYQYLPLIFSPDYFIIYFSIPYIFFRVPECLAKDQK